jgi:predicted nucleic acid-binding protein
MKYYAVIDTNVLVSAMLKWDSVPGNIMELVYNGQIREMPILVVTGKGQILNMSFL